MGCSFARSTIDWWWSTHYVAWAIRRGSVPIRGGTPRRVAGKPAERRNTNARTGAGGPAGGRRFRVRWLPCLRFGKSLLNWRRASDPARPQLSPMRRLPCHGLVGSLVQHNTRSSPFVRRGRQVPLLRAEMTYQSGSWRLRPSKPSQIAGLATKVALTLQWCG